MSVVDMPCEYEEWWDYQKVFLLLSHARSMQDLNTLISSHTRTGGGEEPYSSPTSKCLGALKGLLTFLTEYYTPEQQKKFVSQTLPYVARAASLLEERIPLSGIPCLQKQENSSLVLGRKVVLSILANGFLCTFPPCGEATFSFEKLFAIFQSNEPVSKKREQAEKLHCFLCYFDRVASDKCNMSGVITYRRQVLAFKDLPRVVDWENNSSPLCPFEVDDDNAIDESGGHTLQVCFGGNQLGGSVFGKGCGEEEFRFCVYPELMVTRLIMEPRDENEVVIVTGAERFCNCSSTDATFKFAGDHSDESECDVFGNILSSLLLLDTQPLVLHSKLRDQYHADFILQELNKAYSGFHCQQDRGDISTTLLALSVKRGSIAFVAEDYPECGAPFRTRSHQTDLDNIPAGAAEPSMRMPPPPPAPGPTFEPSSPLSPIAEVVENVSFSTYLADDIIQAGLKQVEVGSRRAAKQPEGEAMEEAASNIINAIFEHPSDLFGKSSSSDSTVSATPSMKSLANALAASIVKASTTPTPCPAPSKSVEALDKRSNSIARSIIADVLTSSPPPPLPTITTPQTVGEASSSSSVEGLSSMAANMSGGILSDVLGKCLVPVPPSPITIQLEGKDRRISSLTNPNPSMALYEYINELTNRAIDEGISVAQEEPIMASPKPAGPTTAPATMKEQVSDEDVIKVAEDLVEESIQNSLKRIQPSVEELKEPSVCPTVKKQSAVNKGLPLGAPPITCPPANGELPETTNKKPLDPAMPKEPVDADGAETTQSSVINSRLLTPMSSRAGYAWSIASTRDEDSRPVSPTDLNKLGLSLSSDADEFSSMFSDIVINNAITNVSGEKPQVMATEEEEHTSLPSSSKIGIFLSKLGEAEAPSDPGMTAWQNMRRQLLRPITTSTWGRGGVGGAKEDPQLMAMVQWMATSASGRPRLFLYSSKEKAVKQLPQVISQLRSKFWTVGQLCRALVTFGKKAAKENPECDLLTFLSQNS